MNTNRNGMLPLQAQQIALAILKHEAMTHELEINPLEDRWERRAKRWGVEPKDLQRFILTVRLPITVERAFGIKIQVATQEGYPALMTLPEQQEIALQILQGRGVDLRVDDFQSRLERLSRGTGIEAKSLWDFHLQYLISSTTQKLARLVGSSPLSITISDENPDTDQPSPTRENEFIPGTPHMGSA